MYGRKLVFPVGLMIVSVAWGSSLAVADTAKTDKPQGEQGEMALPPGWTPDDMSACAAAATPGAEHEKLQKAVGKWKGEGQMWMAPDTEPMPTTCTANITSIMDGHFTKTEFSSEMMGMPFSGLGFYGYDNVTKKYVCTWMDNQGTAMLSGTGEASPDGKTITWTYNYHCPITKKPATMRQVDHATGDNTMTMELFANDPKTGKEFKMMSVNYTRSGEAEAESKHADAQK